MRAFFVATPLLLALTACLGDLPPIQRVGLVNVRAFSNSGTPVVRGSALFFEVRSVQLVPVEPQACALYGYTPGATTDNGGVTLNAGTAVSFTVGAESETATSVRSTGNPVYSFTPGAYLDFVGGDSALVSVPGADEGFAPFSVKARLAEPFTADTLPTLVQDAPLNLTWQAATSPGSIMIVSLRFNFSPDATTPNVEVACVFTDDGTGQVPTQLTNQYYSSAPAARSYAFIRLRDRFVVIDDLTRARVRSTYEFPLTDIAEAP